MEIYWIINVIVLVAGILFLFFNELEDECMKNTWKKDVKFLWWTFDLDFLNAQTGWKKKWKLDDDGNLIPNTTKHWYYFTVDPKYVEKFYLSSTMFVWLTDGEHLFQFIKKRMIDIGFLAIGWQFFVAWSIGTMIMQFIKEKFLPWLR